MSKIPLQVSPSSMSFQNGHGVIIELLLLCRREDSFLYLRVYDLRGKEKKIHPFPVRILIVRLLVINLDKVHINII